MITTTIGLILSYKYTKHNSMTKEEKIKVVGQALLDLTKDVIDMLPDDGDLSFSAIKESTEEAINRCFRTILPLLDLEEKPSRREQFAAMAMQGLLANPNYFQEDHFDPDAISNDSIRCADALLVALAESEQKP